MNKKNDTNKSKLFLTVLVLTVLLLLSFLFTQCFVASNVYADDNGDIIVYVTQYGEKYHCEGCQYLWNSAIPIPLKEAVIKHKPCSKCNPPVLYDNAYLSENDSTDNSAIDTYRADAYFSIINSRDPDGDPNGNYHEEERIDTSEILADNGTILVCYKEYGTIYHRMGCPESGNMRGKKTISLQRAYLIGLSPCELCKPPLLGGAFRT